MATDPRDGIFRLSQPTSADATKSNPLTQLIKHHDRESEVVREKVKQLTKFKEDYEVLKARLETLPDKVSHEIMVPFGKLAFIPGRVKHTNEILCLLGDNWFVERSAKQAAQIVDRRIKGCNETLKQYQGELKLMAGWCDQTKKLSEELDLTQGVNIIETEEDEGWREEHRRRVREHKQKMAAQKQQQQHTESQSSEEEMLLRRLDELELEEELQHELDKLGVEDDETSNSEEEETDQGIVNEENEEEEEEERSRNKKKSVRWSESPDNVKQFRRDELILPRTTTAHDDDEDHDTLKITFKHSTAGKKKTARFAATPCASSGDPSSVVSSPSEIFRKFNSASLSTTDSGEPCANEPKSILKVKKSTTPVIEIVQEEEAAGPEPDAAAAGPTATDRPSLLQQQQILAAVGDEVKERRETATSTNVTDAAAAAVDQESVNTHRPVSRFRAARMNKKL